MEWKTLLMALAMASMVVAIPRPQDDEDEEDAGGIRTCYQYFKAKASQDFRNLLMDSLE
jgi:hypothetical protein